MLRRQLEAVAVRMPGRPALAGMLDRGETRALVERLLVEYYDPLYENSEAGRSYAATVDTTDPTAAAQRVLELVDRR
jgi:hypothetical protein